MYKLTVGVDFGNKDYIKGLIKLYENNNGPVKIESVYGAVNSEYDILGAARESHRISGELKDISRWEDSLIQLGIEINYVCNSFTLTPKYLIENRIGIIKFFKMLKDIGVSGVIIASPLLISFAKEAGLKIIISTILHVDTREIIEYYIEQGVDTIVLSIYKNRDFDFLDSIKKYKEKVNFELMVNEACINPCPWRIQHYIQESLGTKESYYFAKCYNIIKNNFPKSIINGNWIRPEDLINYYDITDIEKFKITGRTFNHNKMLKIIEAYLNQSYNGNLMDLFPLVRGGINLEKEEKDHNLFIDNKSLKNLFEEIYAGCSPCYKILKDEIIWRT